MKGPRYTDRYKATPLSRLRREATPLPKSRKLAASAESSVKLFCKCGQAFEFSRTGGAYHVDASGERDPPSCPSCGVEVSTLYTAPALQLYFPVPTAKAPSPSWIQRLFGAKVGVK